MLGLRGGEYSGEAVSGVFVRVEDSGGWAAEVAGEGAEGAGVGGGLVGGGHVDDVA